MNYYNEIKEKLIKNEVFNRAKDYSKEKHTLITYYEVGKLLDETGKHYGEDITVGIIICKKNNQYIIEYCSDKRILSREYTLS